jgi:MFS family permease
MPDPQDPSKLAYEPPDDQRPASAAAPAEAAINARPPARDPYAALRYANFAYYQLGWICAVIGDQIMEVAVGWDIYQRTHDPLSLGWVGLVSALPIILLALPAGHIADRFDRRQIVIYSQLVRAACVIGLALISYHHGSIGAMYAVLFVIAITKAIGWAARAAMLPALVPVDVFANAVNWNSSAFQMSAMIGPALGGMIVRWNVPIAYVIGAALAIVFAALMLPLKIRYEPPQREPATLRSLAAGVHFVLNTKIILALITLDLFAVLLGGAIYLLPIFATDYLHVGAIGFGWLRAAPGLGAVTMGLLIAHMPPFKHAGRAMLWAVAGFGVATIAFGLSRNFWFSLTMLFVTGALDNISVLVRHTLVQVLTPDAMRGRVSAVNNIFIGASNELGGFESGATARFFGTITSVVAGGIGTIAAVILVGIVWPQVRRFGSLADAKAEPERTKIVEVISVPGSTDD